MNLSQFGGAANQSETSLKPFCSLAESRLKVLKPDMLKQWKDETTAHLKGVSKDEVHRKTAHQDLVKSTMKYPC